MRGVFINIVRFALLVILQALVLSHIQFSGMVNPYPYILFVLLLPFSIHPVFLILLSAMMGMCIDFFSYTPGMHTSAMVLLGFMRPYLLSFLSPHDGYEGLREPGISTLGFVWFLKYAMLATLIHHIMLFFAEAFELYNIHLTVLRIVFSSIFTIILLVIAEYLSTKRIKV